MMAVAFYAPEKIGETRRLTPEGFLVCEGVPIARTGVMVYGPGEVPIDPGPDGIVRVERDDATVFAEETVASFLGKPVTDGHPTEDVNPDNWRLLAKGAVHNPRRGDGVWTDCLVADLIITDAEAIKSVIDGKVEVSCGYDADYEMTGPGRGRQLNIIGNHVALVENGRCGSRCSIGDNAMTKRKSFADRIRAAFKARDAAEEELESALAEGAEGAEEAGKETHVHVHVNAPGAAEKAAEDPVKDAGEGEEDPIEARFAKIEAAISALAETVGKLVTAEKSEAEAHKDISADDDMGGEEDGEKTEDEAAEAEEDAPAVKTTDAASIAVEIADVKARAEILSPGIKFPTFDAKADPKKVRDSLCALRRKALSAALVGEAGSVISPLVTDIKKMTCDAVGVAFVGASELIRHRNNDRGIGYDRANRDASGVAVSTIAEINKANREFWAKRS